MRKCFRCQKVKPFEDYYRSNTRYYQRECKTCNRERKGAWHKTETGKQSSRRTKLKARFGLTPEAYEVLLQAQHGQCKVCGAKESAFGHRLAVDHDHETGRIRGLLCKRCNVGIGNLCDNPELLIRAVQYLKGEL